MNKGISRFYVHTVQVEMFLGTDGYGADLFQAPVNIVGMMDDGRKLVRGKDGAEVISESTFATWPVNAPLFVPASRVTFGSVVSRVIKTNDAEMPGLNLPDHVEVSLT